MVYGKGGEPELRFVMPAMAATETKESADAAKALLHPKRIFQNLMRFQSERRLIRHCKIIPNEPSNPYSEARQARIQAYYGLRKITQFALSACVSTFRNIAFLFLANFLTDGRAPILGKPVGWPR